MKLFKGHVYSIVCRTLPVPDEHRAFPSPDEGKAACVLAGFDDVLFIESKYTPDGGLVEHHYTAQWIQASTDHCFQREALKHISWLGQFCIEAIT